MTAKYKGVEIPSARVVKPASLDGCARCGAMWLRADGHDERDCLERQLEAIYLMGVDRGLSGERPNSEDDRASVAIGKLLSFVSDWQGAKATPPPAPAPEPPAPSAFPPLHDLDSAMARFLNWRAVGWLDGQEVHGEAAWHDPRVVRRRYSAVDADAALVREHPLVRSLELMRIHRVQGGGWVWTVARPRAGGRLEFVAAAPKAPMAICLAARHVAPSKA